MNFWNEATEQGRRWMWVINNPPADPVVFTTLPEGVRFITWQLERGAEGTPHLQGYLSLFSNWRRRRVENLLGNHAWVAAAYAPEQNCIEYCSKEDTRVQGPWNIGERVARGERKDLKPLEKATQMVKEGAKFSDIATELPEVWVKHAAGLQNLARAVNKPKMRDVKVICIKGPTGIGKTWWVYEHFGLENVYKPLLGNSGVWWDGYEGQEVLFLDEFKGQMPLQKLLLVLDRYPFISEVKGASTWSNWNTVVICTNSEPDTWYPNVLYRDPQTFMALRRRLGLLPELFPEQRSHWVDAQDRESLHSQLALIDEPTEPHLDEPTEPHLDEPTEPEVQRLTDQNLDINPFLGINDDVNSQEIHEMLEELIMMPVERTTAPTQPVTPILIEDDSQFIDNVPIYSENMCNQFP